MDEFRKENFGSKEEEPGEPDLKVDLIRHGEPKYTEEEINSAMFEGELTDGGAKQIENIAHELADEIDERREIVVLWVSPKRRAQQTARIVLDVFRQRKIPIILKNPSTVRSLSDVKVSPEFIADLEKNNAFGEWMRYWTESKELPEGTEKPKEVKRRVRRLITYLERAAKKVIPKENRKLRFICVGHEEIFRDLLEEGYGTGTRKNSGPSYGEIMKIDLAKSSQEKSAKLELTWRGEKAELSFDEKGRRFQKIETAR